MGQKTTGIRSILSNPLIYSLFQTLMGAHKGRQRFAKLNIRSKEKDKVLDIGCGPADILNYIGNVEYYGFDVSQNYINQAQRKFGKNGKFFCKELDINDIDVLPKFDIVIAMGLLHHVNDNNAKEIIKLANLSLKSGGRLITLDPCIETYQNVIAKFLINRDRGQNVRNKEGYMELVKNQFKEINITVKNQKWIPYTHCIMECTK